MAVLYRNTVMVRANGDKWVAVKEGSREQLAVHQKELQGKGFKTKIHSKFDAKHLK